MKRDGDPLPVVHSVFAAAALVPVLQERYEIGRIGDCALERSYVNDVFRLTTAAGARYYLKVYRSDWRSLADVARELRLQEHLEPSAVSIARPIPQRDGLLMTVLNAPEGERGAVLYVQAPGSKPQHPFTAELYARFGRASGELHAALDTLPNASGRPTDDIETLVMAPGRALLAGFAPDTDERHAIDAIVGRLAEEIRRQSPALD